MVGRVLKEGQRRGQLDLEAGEQMVREAMHRLGGLLLEQLLGADGGGYQGARIDCGQGHEAHFEGYRDKQLLTVLGAVQLAPLGLTEAPYLGIIYHSAPDVGSDHDSQNSK